MSLTYRNRLRETVLRKMRNMRAAKEHKRLENAVAMRECGIILFDGESFGGKHRIRLLTDDIAPVLWLEIDGHIHRPRSYRGVLRLLAMRISHSPTLL